MHACIHSRTHAYIQTDGRLTPAAFARPFPCSPPQCRAPCAFSSRWQPSLAPSSLHPNAHLWKPGLGPWDFLAPCVSRFIVWDSIGNLVTHTYSYSCAYTYTYSAARTLNILQREVWWLEQLAHILHAYGMVGCQHVDVYNHMRTHVSLTYSRCKHGTVCVLWIFSPHFGTGRYAIALGV